MSEFHLWREYDVKPFSRFACTVVEAADATDGFRIKDWDPKVADSVFLHRVHEHMQKPHPVHEAYEDEISDKIKTAHPGEPGHFAEAVRSIPTASIRPTGRHA
ncbi:MAG: hypothetical protein CMB99_01455 [Flavobacteriaceae bacterium]|nr:hypothetical protein [Flavobacteriaceae bacterium]|tara:strand:- start:2387 stop:2695 length:309 start_codon:yes stop_codon:yes gene_type:complete